VQVKEKFGTLRFYHPGNDAIDRYVRLAERLSSVTCEDCGKRGMQNDSGWIRTQCDVSAALNESPRSCVFDSQR
jgi:hypothetical protein